MVHVIVWPVGFITTITNTVRVSAEPLVPIAVQPNGRTLMSVNLKVGYNNGTVFHFSIWVSGNHLDWTLSIL